MANSRVIAQRVWNKINDPHQLPSNERLREMAREEMRDEPLFVYTNAVSRLLERAKRIHALLAKQPVQLNVVSWTFEESFLHYLDTCPPRMLYAK